MKIAKLAAFSSAAAAMALPLAGLAHAGTDGPADITFKSPTGNIACDLAPNLDGAASCEIRDHIWPTPASSLSGQPCDFTVGGQHFNLFPGKASDVSCYQGAGLLDSPNMETLDYGQTRSINAITCDSEPDGITCTDSGTGHFFRLSSDSYQLS
jgi:hypothetical protein